MGRGGSKSDWQLQVDRAYKEWKYNDLHKNVKTHFKEANSKGDCPERLKQPVDENCPIINDLNELHDNVGNEKKNIKDRICKRDSSNNIKFLGAKIELPENDVDEVDGNKNIEDEVCLNAIRINIADIIFLKGKSILVFIS